MGSGNSGNKSSRENPSGSIVSLSERSKSTISSIVREAFELSWFIFNIIRNRKN